MYCAYPVPGVGSSSLMYYYNGKTVRGRLCSPRRGSASLRRASRRPGATCWRAGGRGLREGPCALRGDGSEVRGEERGGAGPERSEVAAARPGRGSARSRAERAAPSGRAGEHSRARERGCRFSRVRIEARCVLRPGRCAAALGIAPNSAWGDADTDRD